MEIDSVSLILGLLGGSTALLLVLATLLWSLFLFLVVLLGVRNFKVKMDDYHRGGLHFPKLSLIILGEGETLNEGNPVLNGDSHELTKVSVHDVLEAVDNTLKRRCLIFCTISLKEIVVAAKVIYDFTIQEITPLYKHVLRN